MRAGKVGCCGVTRKDCGDFVLYDGRLLVYREFSHFLGCRPKENFLWGEEGRTSRLFHCFDGLIEA